MPSEATLRLTGGGDPVRVVAAHVDALLPTEADVLAICEWKRARVVSLTGQGRDYLGRPFAPYSTRAPYTWYPHGHGTKSPKQRAAAAKRFAKKLGAGSVTASGGVRFESYAAFKRALGRSGVDLTGPSAPHMLQALVSRVVGPLEGRIGIYSADKAEIAEYHTTGTARMPQRRFLGTAPEDVRIMIGMLVWRAEHRARANQP